MDSAFVLHARPWRETSLILECFTLEHGRKGLLGRGRRGERHHGSSDLQPFNLLEVGWRGRGELPTLVQSERVQGFALQGRALYAGLYLNELLLRVLQRDLPLPGLFQAYVHALAALSRGDSLEPPLRQFELTLVRELGYGVALDRDRHGQPVEGGHEYQLVVDAGLERLGAAETDAEIWRLPGTVLLALARNDFEDARVRRTAKRLTRVLLAPLLGDRPLRARELFRRSR